MSLAVFAAVLLAAAIHAGWNAIVKRGSDPLLASTTVAGVAGLIAFVALPLLPRVDTASWPYLIVSAVLESAYYVLLASAYRHADMSRAYPLMRGAPPLIVAIISAVALGVTIHPLAWLGVALISAGILSIALGRPHARRTGIIFALATAVVIAGYTLVDGVGVRVSGAPLTYTMWIFLLTGTPLSIWSIATRQPLIAYVRANWLAGLAGGTGTLAAYGIVLWAMTEAPVPLVAALREVSIVFGTLLAVLVLRERVTLGRVIAVLTVVAGAVFLRLA